MPIYDEEEILEWLISKISSYTSIPEDEIETDQPVLDIYGLSSVNAVSLCGELEDWIGSPVSPDIVWEYPTLIELANHLSLRDGAATRFAYRLIYFIQSTFSPSQPLQQPSIQQHSLQQHWQNPSHSDGAS